MECAELQSVVLVPPFSWFCCLCCLFLFITALVIPKITIVTIAQQIVLVPVIEIPHALVFTTFIDDKSCPSPSKSHRSNGACTNHRRYNRPANRPRPGSWSYTPCAWLHCSSRHLRGEQHPLQTEWGLLCSRRCCNSFLHTSTPSSTLIPQIPPTQDQRTQGHLRPRPSFLLVLLPFFVHHSPCDP